ncbi:428_t:CDS:2, partial [Scutellospora calospora]
VNGNITKKRLARSSFHDQTGLPTCVHVEPQSYSLNGSHSAPAPELRSQGSTRLHVPFYHAGVITSQLPGGTTGPRLPVTTPSITNSTTGIGHIIVAIDQVASKIVNLTTSSSSGSNETMSGSRRPQEEPENALSVLLAALPVDVASSIEAG